MNIAYVRVSTVEQNEGRQREGLSKYGIDKWYIEKASAKDAKRPQLNAMLDFAREGDYVYVWDFSRLSRSVNDLLSLTEQFQKKRINLISIKENFDTSTPTGKLMLTMIGAINEFERTNLLERQREGIALARQQGKYKGRKKIGFPDNWEEVYTEWKSRQITGAQAMNLLNLKRNTFYNLIKEYEEKNN